MDRDCIKSGFKVHLKMLNIFHHGVLIYLSKDQNHDNITKARESAKPIKSYFKRSKGRITVEGIITASD